MHPDRIHSRFSFFCMHHGFFPCRGFPAGFYDTLYAEHLRSGDFCLWFLVTCARFCGDSTTSYFLASVSLLCQFASTISALSLSFHFSSLLLIFCFSFHEPDVSLCILSFFFLRHHQSLSSVSPFFSFVSACLFLSHCLAVVVWGFAHQIPVFCIPGVDGVCMHLDLCLVTGCLAQALLSTSCLGSYCFQLCTQIAAISLVLTSCEQPDLSSCDRVLDVMETLARFPNGVTIATLTAETGFTNQPYSSLILWLIADCY